MRFYQYFIESLFTAFASVLLFSVASTSGSASASASVIAVSVAWCVVGVVGAVAITECSVMFTLLLPSLVRDCSGVDVTVAVDAVAAFERFNCECSQHLVDVHNLAYFVRMAFSAAITSSYDGGKTL